MRGFLICLQEIDEDEEDSDGEEEEEVNKIKFQFHHLTTALKFMDVILNPYECLWRVTILFGDFCSFHSRITQACIFSTSIPKPSSSFLNVMGHLFVSF